MKHYSYAKTTALMCSAAFIMIGLTSNAAFSAPTVTGTKGCIVKSGGNTYHTSSRSGSDHGGGGDYDYAGSATCRTGSNQWPSGTGQPRSDVYIEANFVTADEVNSVINQVVNIIDQRTQGDGGAKDRDQDGRLDGHDKDISDLRDKDKEQDGRLDGHDKDISDLRDKDKEQDGRLDGHDKDISDLRDKDKEQDGRLDGHDKDISDLRDKDKEQDGRLDGHDKDISDLRDKDKEHDGRLDGHDKDIAAINDGAVFYNRDQDGNKTGGVTLNDGTGNTVQLGNVATGKTGNDAVNVDQLNGTLAGLGGGAKVEADGTVTKPTYNIGGANYDNVGDALKAQGDLSVQYVADENGKPTNKIILTGNGDGSAVSIGNVKAAEADHEAVNYGQVKDNVSYDRNADGSRSNVVTMKGGSNGTVAIRNVSDGVNDSDAATYRQVKQSYSDSKDYTDQQVNNLRDSSNEKFSALNGELAEVRKESRAGIASAMAAAGLRYDDRAGKGSIAMGMGGFKNATSIAAGVGYTSEDGNWRLNSAIAHSFSGSATSWNAGVSWTFN